MKRIYFLSILFPFAVIAHGQYSLTTSSYTQDFNGLGTATSAGVTGGSLNNVSAALNGWYFLELLSAANTTITEGTGSSATGDTYNFGLAANADRALGGLRSGTLNPIFGFYFTNNTGSTITALQISYIGKTWRRGFNNRADRIDFQYNTTATTLSGTGGVWNNVDALDYSSPVSGLPIGSGSILHSAVINNYILNLNIANGARLFIRWSDLDATDADDGLSIDDFTMTVADPTPVVFYSKSSGNLTSLATWGDDASGSGTAPTNFTNPFQEFNIVNRSSTTLNANWVVSGVNSKVILGDGASSATLILPSSAALTGRIDVSDQATLRLENNTLPTLGIIEDGSTINYAQTGTFTLPIGTYHNLTITNGAKTLGNGNTIVTGNMVLDAVTSLNGTLGGSSSTIILTGNLTLQNGAAFATTGALPALEIAEPGTHTLSGGEIRLNDLETTDDDASSFTILLSNANLTLSSLRLYEPAHTLSLNGNTLSISSNLGDPTDVLGSISGSSTSNISISIVSGATTDVGILRMTAGAQVLRNLEYRNQGTGADLELGSPLSISNNLNFIAGSGSDRIKTTATNLLTIQQSAAITGFSPDKYIEGPLARATNAAGNYLFPIGAIGGTEFKQFILQIQIPGNPSTFRIQYFDVGIHTTSLTCETNSVSGYKINEYWDIARTSGSSPASFSILFDGQNINPAEWSNNIAPQNGDGIVIAHYVPPIGIGSATTECWENISGSAPLLPITQTQVRSNELNSFSLFTLGFLDFGPLPVKFGNVKAYQHSNGIKIDWTNFTESDVVNYKVERSADGQTFIPLSTVNPSVNSGGRADYSHFDPTPFAGINFYRIQSLETDGKKLYSVIVKVDTKGSGKVIVYPNPVTDGQLVLQTPNLKRGTYNVNIFNSLGQKVYNMLLNHSGGFVTQSVQLPASLKTGIYNLQLLGDGINHTKIFVVQ